ncbi:MAG: PIN domain-containing protein [Acidobacteriota bacterium]|jgi:predicted nucleic acid-binding protein|nr:PIN domain-containing protein [Acidobacteriota bacterium]
MSGKSFIDTNLLIYLYTDKEPGKTAVATRTIAEHDCVISVQVMNEFSSVMMKKYGKRLQQVLAAMQEILENVIAVPIGAETTLEALRVCEQYGYSYYDSCIIAAALINGCDILFTEEAKLYKARHDRENPKFRKFRNHLTV